MGDISIWQDNSFNWALLMNRFEMANRLCTLLYKKVYPVISEEDSFQDGSLWALWVSVRLTFVPPKKANLTFKRSHYLTSSQPRPAAAFPLGVSSLFEICLILPLLMSATLCHPLEQRKWPEKWWQQSSRFHLQWWWDILIHYSSSLTPPDTLMTQWEAGKLPIY